jgi:hypothetical protein
MALLANVRPVCALAPWQLADPSARFCCRSSFKDASVILGPRARGCQRRQGGLPSLGISTAAHPTQERQPPGLPGEQRFKIGPKISVYRMSPGPRVQRIANLGARELVRELTVVQVKQKTVHLDVVLGLADAGGKLDVEPQGRPRDVSVLEHDYQGLQHFGRKSVRKIVVCFNP